MAYSILIVDDQREVIRVLESALETLSERFIITGVLSGEEALLEAHLSHIDLLISDIRLPGMSGLELFGRIRILRPKVKTILLTGIQEEKTLDNAANAGADAFFTKPIDISDFLTTVARILSLTVPRPSVEPVIPSEPEKKPESTLSDRLTRLHKELPAVTVSLIDQGGEVLMRAGSPTDSDLETAVLPSLLSILGAGEKVSRFLGRHKPGNIFYFEGQDVDLVMTPISGEYGLVALISSTSSPESIPQVHLSLRTAGQDLADILSSIGVPISIEEPVEMPPFLTEIEEIVPPREIELDDDLGTLLEGDIAEEVRSEADAFWEPEEETSGVESFSADALSYEQALRLGLGPEDV